MKFEFYVLNYNTNARKVEMFNIFQNSVVLERAEKLCKKYIRNPHKFVYKDFEDNVYTGFDGFCKELSSFIRYQEKSRREYEISVGDAFETDCENLEKWDCYSQAEPNVAVIAREILYQYRRKIKEKNRVGS